MIVAIPLPFRSKSGAPTPPLHGNQRYTDQQARRIIREVKADIGWLAKHHRLGKGHAHISVRLVWRPATVRRRDGNENLGPLIKALVDGLVAVRVVPDDDMDLVTREHPIVLPPDKARAGLWLVVHTR